MSIIIHEKEVTCCNDCPENIAYPNPIHKALPEAHYCRDAPHPRYKEGHPITFSRFTIPEWCPHKE